MSQIRKVLLASVVVYENTQPPPAGSRTMRHRDVVLQALLPNTLRGRCRRAVLQNNLRGDITSDSTDIYMIVPPGADPGTILQEWAFDTEAALLPAAHKTFSRHRWPTGLSTVQGPALLSACHRLLQRAVPLWLQSLGRKVPAAAGQGGAVRSAEGEDHDEVVNLPAGADPQRRWEQEAARARTDALTFANSEPTVSLLLFLTTMQPQVKLMQRFLFEGSAEWDLKQERQALETGARTWRVVEVFIGASTGGFFNESSRLLTDQSAWGALHPTHRAVQVCAKAFSHVARAIGGVFMLISFPLSSCPFRLWTLLTARDDDDLAAKAAELFYTPKCMMDKFSRDFMTLFPSRADLVSPTCLATLKAIGVILRLCIARIECRHAAVRRLLLSRGATWAEQLCVASADWLMMRDRIIELAADANHRHLQGASEAQQPARPAQRGSGGGGPCRAFMSEFLRGKSFANRDQLMREGHAEFRRIKAKGGAAWQRLLGLGAAGTAAARASGHAFGRPARRGTPAAVGPAPRQPVSRLLGGPAQPQKGQHWAACDARCCEDEGRDGRRLGTNQSRWPRCCQARRGGAIQHQRCPHRVGAHEARGHRQLCHGAAQRAAADSIGQQLRPRPRSRHRYIADGLAREAHGEAVPQIYPAGLEVSIVGAVAVPTSHTSGRAGREASAIGAPARVMLPCRLVPLWQALLRMFVFTLQQTVRKAFSKHTHYRQVLSEGMAVLCFEQNGRLFWLYVAYQNLITWRAAILPLDPEAGPIVSLSAEVAGRVALACRGLPSWMCALGGSTSTLAKASRSHPHARWPSSRSTLRAAGCTNLFAQAPLMLSRCGHSKGSPFGGAAHGTGSGLEPDGETQGVAWLPGARRKLRLAAAGRQDMATPQWWMTSSVGRWAAKVTWLQMPTSPLRPMRQAAMRALIGQRRRRSTTLRARPVRRTRRSGSPPWVGLCSRRQTRSKSSAVTRMRTSATIRRQRCRKQATARLWRSDLRGSGLLC